MRPGGSDTLERRGPTPAPAHMDPRIRARRIEVNRDLGRHRLRRLIDSALVVLVAAGFAAGLRSPLLDVDRVTVAGSVHTPADEVIQRAGISPGDQLMDLDLAAAGQRVAELPWVARVELHRSLDGHIALKLTERLPVAVIGSGQEALLVGSDGHVLGPVSADPTLAGILPRLVDNPWEPATGDHLPAAAGPLELAARSAGLGSRLSISLAPDLPLTARLEGGTEVRFGDAGRLDAKVRSLRTVLDQVDLSCAAVIDLRSPGSPVLTREQGCS